MINFLLSLLLCAFAEYSFYPKNYHDSRAQFFQLHSQISERYPNAQIKSLKIPTDTNENLSIESLYIPQKNDQSDRLLIITSGVHGVEAYTGSAIQFDFLSHALTPELLQSMGVLIVHSVNPYGYHFNRRVSENNIDLNRNLSASTTEFHKQITSYEKFDNFLNPTVKASDSLSTTVSLFLQSLYRLVKYGKKQIAQIAVGGQYQQPKGIYYGGSKAEPHASILRDEFIRTGSSYKKILHIDLHTGYGERGKLHLFSNHKVAKFKGFKELFQGFSVDFGSDKDFYKTSGSIDFFTVQTFRQAEVVPMTFEFGTMDSQTILGGFFSLKNMIQENQGFHYGYVDQTARQKIEKNFQEMFNPSDSSWRKQVLAEARETLEIILQRFSKL